jgi:hypothetical protein
MSGRAKMIHSFISCVEAGLNTSTVTLRIVGSDEKGSLKSERVSLSPKGLGHEKDCAGKGQQHIQKTDPSSHKQDRKCQTVINIWS